MRDDEALLPTISEAELAQTVAELGPLAQTIAQSPNSTIEPVRDGASVAGRRALAGLEGERHAEIAFGLDLGGTIGEGGMGVVRSATQRSLGRKVAVKTLRSDARTEQATLRLLREGWVTGALEHPNIVPVHDLGLDADGTPVIVLKHIEGRSWSELIRVREGDEDLLERNLRIFVQVSNAVSLAHSRGIVHRDLKPENVMIGRFGEVYLVDWGIAVSLRPDPTGRLPLASEATEMAGTPAYMAPEMLGRGTIGERTDVYLLGAVLHEILTGRPPHVGETFQQMVRSIVASSPALPEDVPAELAAIVRRAMNPRADARHASVDDLRRDLEWYLRQRGSIALSSEASRRVDDVRELLASGDEPDSIRERMHHLFAEARFGFRQAVRASSDNEAARAGLAEVTAIVVDFELTHGTPEAAAAALAELETPPPALQARVTEAMRRRDAEKVRVAKLEELGAELDPATGRRTRMTASALMAAFWTTLPLLCGWLFRKFEPMPRWGAYLISLSILVVMGGIVSWGRESLSKTAINRRVQAIVLLMVACQLTLQLGGNLLLLPLMQLLVLHIFVWFFSTAVFVVFVDRVLWPSLVAFFAAFLAACSAPAYLWIAMSASNAVLMVNLVAAWSRPVEDKDFFMMRVRERRDRSRRDR